ncbi:MAG: HD domain-containing protein [Eubacteriales bacterium]|nr:HD domain-containing protein [Clostridiales bacterium]MDY5835927.1 HD domain-containing protein [Eubacteriales bacterium]
MLSPAASIREYKEAEELQVLSPYAVPAAKSRGRRRPEDQCATRTAFERDIGRIIYSLDFRRLRHKTQVFFNPRSDHVCTRMEHVIYVSYIARTIGKALRLNEDLIEAIALGHDLGHAPFGHSGEAELNAILRREGAGFEFKHEIHSLRVIDVLAEHRGKRQGLNLTFEVRDGIVSHCGERYLETELHAARDKREDELYPGAEHHALPASLEGCVVRIADRIAYLGRDIEDASRAGLMDFEDIPRGLKRTLGSSNRDIVNNLVTDIIRSSQGQDAIKLSPEPAQAMSELLQMNARRIYASAKVRRYEFIARQIVDGLYEAFKEGLVDPEALAASSIPVLANLAKFAQEHPEPQASRDRIICDYLAGMTDVYASESFKSIYQI